jgi:hypothetical protein
LRSQNPHPATLGVDAGVSFYRRCCVEIELNVLRGRSDRIDSGDGHDRDARRDQAVFDRGNSCLVFHKRELLNFCANTTRHHWRIVVGLVAVDVAHQVSFDEATSFQIELVIVKFRSTNQKTKFIDLSQLRSICDAR